MFVAGRAITGAGFAGIIGGFFAILTHILPLRKRPFYCGILGGIESIAVLTAPILGGFLTQDLSWRWCFWINLPIGCATLLMTIFLFSDPKPSDRSVSFQQKISQLDLLSNMLFIPGLACLFIALSWASTKYAWSDKRVISLLITFAVLLSAFVWNQRRRGDSAALPPRIMRNRSVIAAAIFSMFTNSAINVLEYYLPTYYQVVLEYPPQKSGYMMAPIVIGSTLGMFLCGSGTSTVGYYAPFMVFSSITMPIFSGLITTFGKNTDFARLILYTGASGFASGIGFNAPMTAVQTSLPPEDVSLGLSIVLFAQHFGPAVSVAVAQVLFTNQLSSNLADILPNSSSLAIGNIGLKEITERAPAALHAKLLWGISRSLSNTWYVAVGLTCATLVGSLLMEWRSVKEKES
jgi:MFS family permease